MRRFLLPLIAAVGLAAPAALAQAPNRNVFSFQPLSAFFGVYNLEFERVLSPGVTGAAGFTYWSFDEDEGEVDVTYLSIDILKLRYYPSGTAPNGFSFGGSVGMTRVEENDPGGVSDESVTAPGLGISLEYSRLLGAQRRFYLGGGIGAKMLFFDEDDFTGDVTAKYPTARVAIGFAF